MGIKRDVLPYELFKIVASKDYGFTIAMFDADGESTVTPLTAAWMYLKPENIMLRIPSENDGSRDEIVLWKSEDLDDPKIKDIIIRLKDQCQLFGSGFTIKDFESNNQPKEFHKMVKREQEENELQQTNESIMLEGLTGTKTRSTLTVESAKMIISHSKHISEEVHGSRSRHIKDIFIECNGERIRYPVKHLPSARAMTRHYASGGSIGDKMGKYIMEQAKDLLEMRSFIKENDTSKFNSKVKSFMESIRQDFTRMQRPKGYAMIKEGVNLREIVGKQIIESRANRYRGIDGLMESTESNRIMEVIARRDIREDLSYQGTFRRVLEFCDLGLNKKIIRNCAKRIARGEINANKPVIIIKAMPMRDKIQDYAKQMALSVNQSEVANAMGYISTADIDNDMANFVKGVMKSINLNDITQSPQPEEDTFEGWVKKQ